MKQYKKIALLTLASLTLVVGCGKNDSSTADSKTDTVETTQSVEKTSTTETGQSGETVEFFAPGSYKVPTDIQPGSYYVVLTDIQYSADDEAKNAYATVEVFTSGDKSKVFEMIEEVGKPYRVNLEEGDKITFDEGYDPTGWTVTFFTADDYKEYQKSEKK